MASFLISDVRIFDGQTVIESGSVLVSEGRIAKLSTEPIHFSGTVISRPGHTLLPGFIDAHVHVDAGNEAGLAQGLRFGVTTQCDLGNFTSQIKTLRKLVKNGDCSDLKAALLSATAEGGWPAPLLKEVGITLPSGENILKTRDQGHEFVREQIRDGADVIKILHESGTAFGMKLPLLAPDVERGIVEEAHRSGLTVVAHAFTLEDTLEILSSGVDGTAHTILDTPPTQELIEAYRRTNAFCIPTLTVIGSSTQDGRKMQERYAHDPRVQQLVSEAGRKKMCECSAVASVNHASLGNAFETVRVLKGAGIDIVCGTDSTGLALGTAYGLSLHQELGMYVESCGLSPIEALRSTTSVSSSRMKFQDRGWIRDGLRADLVLVEGDPTTDIGHTLDIRGVWIAGELCSYYKPSFVG